ncbi:MAG: 50S ribosomal protein L10 [Candidatus Omnitrophota bacterium]
MAEKYGKKTRELMISEIKNIISERKGFLFSSIENIKAADIDVFRKKMRKAGSRYLVLKNRLVKIALKEAGIDELSHVVEAKNILGIGVIADDPVEIAKLMMEFSKGNKGFSVSEGYLEGRVLSADKIKELAELPGREQLIARVVCTINAPISCFVGVLAATLRKVLYVFNAVKEKKEGKE